MIVSEFIELLKKQPQDAILVIERYTGCIEELLPVEDVQILKTKKEKSEKYFSNCFSADEIKKKKFLEIL